MWLNIGKCTVMHVGKRNKNHLYTNANNTLGMLMNTVEEALHNLRQAASRICDDSLESLLH